MVSSMPQLHLTPRKDSVPIVQEAGWAPGPVWTRRKSRPTGIRSPDRPARSQSLYQLSYPTHYIQGGSNMTGTVTGLFTHKSVPVIFEPPCTWLYQTFYNTDILPYCTNKKKVTGQSTPQGNDIHDILTHCTCDW